MAIQVRIAVFRGLRADLDTVPSTGQAGLLAWAIDTQELFVDSGSGMGIGTAWIPVIPPGSAGSHAVQGLANFGPETTYTASVTVSAPWVKTDSTIVCGVMAQATIDHDAEDAVLEGLIAYATNLVQGVGFDIEVAAPGGATGHYLVNAIGV